jgi:intracellular multiplication protein IcmP
MAQQQPQSPGDSPNSNDLMFIVMFCVAVLIGLWLMRAHYLPFVFKFKYYEVLLASYFVDINPKLINDLVYAEYNPLKIAPPDFFLLLKAVGNYYKYIVAGILSIFALIIYIKSPKNKFTKTYNMANFREQEKVNWPQIIPPSKTDLTKVDIKEGPWASAATPMDFAKKNNLLDIIVNPNYNPILGENEKTVKIKEAAARQVFASQLGHLWQGPDQLPIHQKALFVVFTAIINRERKVAENLLREWNISIDHSSTPNFNKNYLDKLCNKYKNHNIVKQAEKRHAYVLTLMATLLELARADGVLACADFLWLKTVDRPLWYMLSNVGRRAAFAEVAGVFAHWKIESRMQKKLMSPMIDEAVKALKIGISEIIYQEEEQ